MRAKSIIASLNVLNDIAERGVKLIDDYVRILTKDDNDLQFLLQTVTEYRKKYQSTTKNCLKQKF